VFRCGLRHLLAPMRRRESLLGLKTFIMETPLNSIVLRFYEELNEYLPVNRRKQDIEVALPEPRTLGSVIISFGIPLSDIDLVLLNGNSVDFDHILEPGDRVSVYPVFERLNLKGVTRLKGRPLRRMRFVADSDLPDLADQMNRSGLDTMWLAYISDPEIRSISIKEKRIILTKRKELLRLPGVTHAVLVHAEDAADQLQEVMSALDIEKAGSDFLKCFQEI
jgi:hypothetical protein